MSLLTPLQNRISGGASSPLRTFNQVDMPPIIIERGEGGRLFDVEGRSYIDLIGAYGVQIHGHAHPALVEAQKKQLEQGICFGLTTQLEEQLAEKIALHMPSMESMRFVTSGTEAVMSAIRLARGYTGRDLIVKFSGNYHGHVDALLIDSGSALFQDNFVSTSAGVPAAFLQATRVLPYNDIEAFCNFMDAHGEKVAAVLVEPIAGNMGVILPKEGFLSLLREKCDKMGSLLLFDEVITGFRIGLGGAQAHFNITPDITILAKIIGGGMPLACFGGRKEILEKLSPTGPVFQAGTFAGHPLSIASGIAAISLCEADGFYERLHEKSQTFLSSIQKKGPVLLQGFGSMFTLFFGIEKAFSKACVKECDLQQFRAFFRHLLERGILIPPSQFEALFISNAHTAEDLQVVQEAINSYFTQSQFH